MLKQKINLLKYKPRKILLSIRLREPMLNDLRKFSNKHQINMSTLIAALIEDAPMYQKDIKKGDKKHD